MTSWRSSIPSELDFLGAQPLGHLLRKELAPFEVRPPYDFWLGTLPFLI